MRLRHYLCLCLLGGSLSAAPLAPLPWSSAMNDPGQYDANSSGKLTRQFDTAERAIRFDVEFEPGTDFWCYPRFRFPEGKSLEGVETLRFEIKAKQSENNAKFRHCYVMFENGMPMATYPAPGPEWQTVELKLSDWVKEPEKVHSLRIGMNPTAPKLTYYLRNVQLLGTPRTGEKIDTSAVVRAEAPATLFTTGEPLRFTTTLRLPALRWEIRNWKGEPLRSGNWPDGGGTPLLPGSLPTGYYTLELSADGVGFSHFRSFTVVADPADRRRNPETFFAMDTAQSWLARANRANHRHPDNGYELVSEAARRAGIEVVRERLSWNQTEPAPGEYRWGEYAANADFLAKRGIAISGMYHDAPARAKGTQPKLPADLNATYRFAETLARTFRGRMLNWEFWNEQDIGFAPEGAWNYAAAMKAAYLGFKAGDPELPVALGGIAITPLANYNQVVMDNGVGDYIDIFNVHTYRPLRDFPDIIRDINKFLDRNGLSSRPVWFTENGSSAEGSGRIASYMEGLKAHDPEQELLVAEYLPKTLIGMQSLGVDRDFFFVFPPYNEGGGNKDWGLLRRDYSAKPGVAAFATLSELLNTAEYRGTLDLGADVRGFLYELPDGSQTVAYWSKSELDTEGNRPDRRIDSLHERTIELPLADGRYTGRDLTGVPFTVQASGGSARLTATRFPAYLTGLHGLKPSQPFTARAKQGAAASVDYDRTVILRADLSPEFKLAGGKDSVDLTAEGGKLVIEAYNLSAEAKRGKVILSGGRFNGVPDELTLPPFGKASFEVEFHPDFPEGTYQTKLRADGLFNGQAISPLVIPVYASGKLVAEARKTALPGMVDPGNWRNNSSGKMKITYDAAESALKFTVSFPPNVDRWVYPEYVLQLPQESLAGAAAISFEIKSNSTAIKNSLLMAVLGTEREEGKSVYLSYPKAGTDWEERVVFFDQSQIDPAKIKQLRLGMNPETDELTYLIRNVQLIYAQ